MVASTGNAPKKKFVHNLYATSLQMRYNRLVQINAKEVIYVKSKKNSSKQLTPVTIMVADTISSVKSRFSLKVLLDSGSTSTMINRKCLPRNWPQLQRAPIVKVL